MPGVAASALFGISLVVDVIRRIGKNEVRGVTSQEPCDLGLVRRVANQQFVTAEDPKIPGCGDRRFRQLRYRIFVSEPCGSILLRQKPRQFRA
jgi:hypothetical protein